ncbi:MAG: hypothetical protein HN411_01790 [Waddliaceae bacterium]|jgi:hypothetical protein|nr:hypothetical protein [Waddliaceae bacterium]MBT3579398.1 hypothetical protein [Waddliaceae bacterium]MBT4444421.1 hypothetical protein [Waddliaceae bacterium]MBT6928741.1 hypothetical protein [Waddliaceae bacterium]MBT7264349.1 hypothetical protein [Waddliaceae bacterium]
MPRIPRPTTPTNSSGHFLSVDPELAKIADDSKKEPASPETIEETASKALGDIARSFSPIAFLTTGSTARGEDLKGRTSALRSASPSQPSPFEVIVVTSDKADERLCQQVQKIVKEDPRFDSVVEFTNLSERRVTWYKPAGTNARVIPTRAMDATFISGDKALAEKYKGSIIPELLEMNGKQFKTFYKSFIKGPINLLKKHLATDESRSCEHLNIEEGLIFYDRSKGLHEKNSTKQVFLRVVQYVLVHEVCKKIREKKYDASFLKSFPNSIAERLEWLYSKGCLNMTREETNDIIAAYRQALTWYHQTQEEYVKEPITLQVDVASLKSVAMTIKDFSDRKDALLRDVAVPPNA